MSKKRYRPVICAALTAGLILTSLACQLIAVKYSSGELILEDDFSSSQNHWDIWNRPDESAVSYLDDGLMMIVSQSNTDVVSTNNISLPDVIVRVKAQKKFGTNDNVYGLACRYQNDKNYYGFLVSSDGYYGIVKIVDGVYSLISSESMEYSGYIKKGKSENFLEAICKGDTLTFLVNKIELAKVIDFDLDYGRTGLVTGSLNDENEIAVIFDDFKAVVP